MWMMEIEVAPDFEQTAAALEALGAGVNAADLHGSWCGYLCAGGQGVARFLDAIALEPALDASDDAAARSTIGRLFRASDAKLDDDEFGFDPLLPDADQPLHLRTDALLQWCQGFVGGLGLGGFRDERVLSKDGREVLRDLIEISRTPVSLDDDEDTDENALVELTEFARVAALLLREDLRSPAALRARSA